MAKRMGSTYLPGRRSPDWRKIKLMNAQDCVILGWTPGKGGRAGSFGALLVGAIDDDRSDALGRTGRAPVSPSACSTRLMARARADSCGPTRRSTTRSSPR